MCVCVCVCLCVCLCLCVSVCVMFVQDNMTAILVLFESAPKAVPGYVSEFMPPLPGGPPPATESESK